MGTIAARTARDIVGNVRRVLATELMAACQAIDFRNKTEKRSLGEGTKAAYDLIRSHISFFSHDKEIEMYKELQKIDALIRDNRIVKAVEEKTSLEI